MEIAVPPQSFYTEEFPARRISGEVVERPREEVPHGVPISLRTVQRSFVSRGRFEPSWSKRLVMAKWVLSGQAVMGIKGDRVSFGPGEVAIYTPSIAHQFWAMGEINEMCWFTMDGPLAEEFVSELQLRPGVYGNVPAPVQQLTELMESLKDRTIQGRRHASLRAIELWYQLANSIRSPEIPSVVTRAQQFIREHFANPDLSTESLAEHLHYHRGSMSRLFHKHTGVTIIEFITQARLHEAKKLLMHTNEKISQIGHKCGFRQSNYFCRWLRKHTGQTPREFRNPAIGEPAWA